MCKLRVWWLYYIGTSHTLRSPYYENFCTTKVTILWLYIVQNVQVTSMVTVLYRHKSHIVITILWKFLYYQGHHTVTLHSTKCQVTSMVTDYIGTSHTRSPYYENIPRSPTVTLHSTLQVTSMVTVLYRHKSPDHHTMKIFVLPKVKTILYYLGCDLTILWLIVQNVQVTSMVTVLYRHKSHIAITILWKFLYYQGHHTVTLHSTKCASYEYGDCTI